MESKDCYSMTKENISVIQTTAIQLNNFKLQENIYVNSTYSTQAKIPVTQATAVQPKISITQEKKKHDEHKIEACDTWFN